MLIFRPHHFLCALAFQGKGYSPAFVANFSTIMQQLKGASGDQTPITVRTHADSICMPCPHRVRNGCTEQSKISALDQKHATILKIQAGDQLTWGEAKNRLKNYMTVDNFHQACDGCEWKSLGICESSLKELLTSA